MKLEKLEYIHIYPPLCVQCTFCVFVDAFKLFKFSSFWSKVSNGNCLQANSAFQVLSNLENFSIFYDLENICSPDVLNPPLLHQSFQHIIIFILPAL